MERIYDTLWIGLVDVMEVLVLFEWKGANARTCDLSQSKPGHCAWIIDGGSFWCDVLYGFWDFDFAMILFFIRRALSTSAWRASTDVREKQSHDYCSSLWLASAGKLSEYFKENKARSWPKNCDHWFHRDPSRFITTGSNSPHQKGNFTNPKGLLPSYLDFLIIIFFVIPFLDTTSGSYERTVPIYHSQLGPSHYRFGALPI